MMAMAALVLRLIYILYTLVASAVAVEANAHTFHHASTTSIHELTDNDIDGFKDALLLNKDHHFLLLFHADWCPACNDFKPAFNLLSDNGFFKANNISAYRVDVEKSPELTARHFIVSLPTLIHVHEGGERVRDISKLRWKIVEYFEEKQWDKINPRDKFKHPFGLAASVLGITTRYGYFMMKEVESLQWSKREWTMMLVTVFGLIWGSIVYLGFIKKGSTKVVDVHQTKESGK